MKYNEKVDIVADQPFFVFIYKYTILHYFLMIGFK